MKAENNNAPTVDPINEFCGTFINAPMTADTSSTMSPAKSMLPNCVRSYFWFGWSVQAVSAAVAVPVCARARRTLLALKAEAATPTKTLSAQAKSVKSGMELRNFVEKETAKEAPSPVITHRPMSNGPLGPNKMFLIKLWCVEQ